MEYCTFMYKFDPKIISDDLLQKTGLQFLSPIEIERQSDSKELNCLVNTKKYISIHGGELQFGWIFTMIGNIVLQLTAHALVKRSDNSLLCVTLNENRKNTVKFSLDNSVEDLIENGFLPGRFITLINDSTLDMYVNLLRRHDELRLMGADNSSLEIQNINHECQELYPNILCLAKKHTGRNDYCYCGSGQKAKSCCG